jgi:hypothetical protein
LIRHVTSSSAEWKLDRVMEAVLSVRILVKRFGGLTAVNDVSFERRTAGKLCGRGLGAGVFVPKGQEH